MLSACRKIGSQEPSCILMKIEERSSPTAVTISSPKHVHYGSATIGNLNIKVP